MHTFSIQCDDDRACEEVLRLIAQLPKEVNVFHEEEELDRFAGSQGFLRAQGKFAQTLDRYKENGEKGFLDGHAYQERMDAFKAGLSKK